MVGLFPGFAKVSLQPAIYGVAACLYQSTERTVSKSASLLEAVNTAARWNRLLLAVALTVPASSQTSVLISSAVNPAVCLQHGSAPLR